MKTWVPILFLVLAACAANAGVEAAPEKALCSVCALNGESEPEQIAASRDFEGRQVHFCSAKCATAFDLDPHAYIFAPSPAPAMKFVSLRGDTINMESLRGKVVVIDFWATWCKPCVKAMPELDALQRDYKGDVVVVGVSIDQGDDREKKVRAFLTKHPVGYPIAIDSGDAPVWELFKVKVLPTLYVVSREGIVVSRHTGAFAIADVQREIDKLPLPGTD